MSGGRPAAPCWPIGRSASCSKGSLVWDGGMYLFFRLFADGFFLAFFLGLAAIVLPNTGATIAPVTFIWKTESEQGPGQTLTERGTWRFK
jgi:hypothetical protein